MVATKLYVGNVPENHNTQELRTLFEKYGNVVEFDILKDFGFVHYESENEAKSAVDALDGHHHMGQDIKVEMSRSQVRQRPGMGGKGECYRCGGDGHWSKECPKGPTRGRSMRGGGRGMGRGRNMDDDFRRGGYDSYDMYPRRPAPHPYDRLRYDPYERRAPVLPPRDYYAYPRETADYYRRSPPRDPYYELYMKRRLEALDRYGDAPSRSGLDRGASSYGMDRGASSYGMDRGASSYGMERGASSYGLKEELKAPLMRSGGMGGRIQGRVPGPY